MQEMRSAAICFHTKVSQKAPAKSTLCCTLDRELQVHTQLWNALLVGGRKYILHQITNNIYQ